MSKRGSRRSRRRGGKNLSGQLGGMLQQVQQMQEEAAKAQEELANETMSVTAGGGAIEITITGDQRVTAIKIDPEVVDPDDVDMLQDLIVAAVNEAIAQSRAKLEQIQAEAAEQASSLLSGLGLPPGLGLG